MTHFHEVYVVAIWDCIFISPILWAIDFWGYYATAGHIQAETGRKKGKECNCCKFRSMCVNSKEVLEQLLAIDLEAKPEWDKEIQKGRIKPMNKSIKTIFLDRDGVINAKAPEGDYIKSWEEFHFLPGVIDAIRLLNDNNYLVIIITNQRGIARHLMTMQDLHVIHSSMEEVLQRHGAHIDGIYVCPHEKGTCHCRKPDIGLFLQAEQEFPVDKSKSWMVGDSESDIEAGRNYGIRTIAVANPIPLADKQFPDLLSAAYFIVNG